MQYSIFIPDDETPQIRRGFDVIDILERIQLMAANLIRSVSVNSSNARQFVRTQVYVVR